MLKKSITVRLVGGAIGATISGLAGLGFGANNTGSLILAAIGCAFGGTVPILLEGFCTKLFSTKAPNVLILEDELGWLQRHENSLDPYGFNYYLTQDARDAIDEAIKRPEIQFGLIDQILYVPNSKPQKRQNKQGLGVIRAIHEKKPDMKFIVVTDLMTKKSKGKDINYIRERAKLKIPGVIVDIVDKKEIEDDPDGAYDAIVQQMKLHISQ